MDTHLLSLLLTSFLNMCESPDPNQQETIPNSLSNVSQSLDQIVTRKKRTLDFPSLDFPTRTLVFPNNSKVVTEIAIIIPTTTAINEFEIGFSFSYNLPSLTSLLANSRSLNLEKEHRGIFQAAEDLLTG